MKRVYTSLYSGKEKLYTSYEYVQLFLRNRLKVYQTEATSIVENLNVVEQKVDSYLVGKLIDQAQSYINGFLDVKYVLPLKLTHPDTILRLEECAGQLVIADLLEIYQYGSNLGGFDQLSPDLGYGQLLKRQANGAINSYSYQDNIAERGGGTSYRGEKVEAKRIDLKGEILRTIPQQGPISAATIIQGTQQGDNEYLRLRQTSNIFSEDYIGDRGFW